VPWSTERFLRYQRKRHRERLALAIERLGGKCVRCGATENLQFDHIVPGSRVRKISEATNWSLERFLAEVDKCQLLCDPCHRQKSKEAGETAHGERNPRAKLTEDDVREIRKSDLSYSQLAVQYGVGKRAIMSVKLGRTWKHTT